MRSIALAVVLSIFVESASALGRPSCLRYEPAVVTLSGTLLARTFAGPPNYESIAQGDMPERAFLLLLDEPVCVEGDPASDLNSETELGVVLVQVGPSESLRSHVGHHVTISGTLMHAITAHHRTAVLLNPGDVNVTAKPGNE